MKVGDLVKHWRDSYKSPGIILKIRTDRPDRQWQKNKMFDIFWKNGKIEPTWDHDVEVISESC